MRYGWNAGCPISILTDFEELVIVDCRPTPDLKFALNASHKHYRYTDYTDREKFAEIYAVFSYEGVANGNIAKYVANMPKVRAKASQKTLFKGGYQAIDDNFLEYIDGVRENMAKAFKKANHLLTTEELTEATQRTVDRLVFIRFLEDKSIEAEDHVNMWGRPSSTSPNGGGRVGAWKDFITDCRKLDAKYNGIVFKKHFIDEPDFIGADESIFLEICHELSSYNSPYNFNYIPIHILGSIYERFLGKIVVATEKRVRIEEKPEVRKAGGVYYTPKYIVDYIVKNTIGKIIEGLTPAQIAGKAARPTPLSLGEGSGVRSNSPLSLKQGNTTSTEAQKSLPKGEGFREGPALAFADIACGSGSFLIGAYEYLLDYHLRYYNTKLTGKTEIDKRSEDFGNTEYVDGQWVLSLKLKQEILLNNIYGVDIDRQAVEVTQLSLFLKMLEDETLSSTQVRQGSMFTKVLPDLTKNIVCGNSLIGWDIMNGQGSLSFGEGEDEAELKKLNPFDYESAFPQVFRNGGFDAVIGNPPYGALFPASIVQYLKINYQVAQYNIDSYYLFIERGLRINKKGGLLGYIIPNTWLLNIRTAQIRNLIIDNYSIDTIVNFKFKVFNDAVVDTQILCLRNENPKFDFKISIEIWENEQKKELHSISQSYWQSLKGATINIEEKTEFKSIKEKISAFDMSYSPIFGQKTGIHKREPVAKRTKSP